MALKLGTSKNKSPVQLPAIGFGTFEATPGDDRRCETAVLEALKTGYRLIDTAALYGSEEAVGRAIRASATLREEIVICTKFWNQYHHPDDVKVTFEESLARLDTDYVDLFLMHWPVAFKRTPDFKELQDDDGKPVIDKELSLNHESTWRAMESLVDSGKTKAIGVSNFDVQQLSELLSFARIKPACNQVEAHPWLPQRELLKFCNDNGIAFMAYSPLGSQSGPAAKHVIDRSLLQDETIVAAANQLNVEPANVLLAWAVQRGTIPVPKSATSKRIKSNFSLPQLSEEVFNSIDSITVRDPSMTKRFVDFDGIWGTRLFASD